MRVVCYKTAALFMLFATLHGTSEPAIAQQNLKNPCSLNYALLEGKKPAELLRAVIFDKVPLQAEPLAGTPRNATSSVVLQIPFSEADYKAVFKKETVSITDKAEIKAAKRFLLRSGLSQNISIKNSDMFEKFLNQTSAKNIIIVGHNDNGSFSFLDGTISDIWMMSERCGKALKNCVFISCRSKDYVAAGSLGVKRDLTLEEGIYIAEKIHGWLKSKTTQITDLNLTKFISEVQTKAHIKYHVAYLALNSCGAAGGGTVLYVVVQGTRE